jgi:hypothetical protein
VQPWPSTGIGLHCIALETARCETATTTMTVTAYYAANLTYLLNLRRTMATVCNATGINLLGSLRVRVLTSRIFLRCSIDQNW